MKLPHLVDKSALVLTAWYTLGIVLISLSFSGVVYGLVQRELGQLERRYQNQVAQFDQLPSWARDRLSSQRDEVLAELDQARTRWLLGLSLANTAIALGGAVVAYFLAKQSVRPLADAAEKQRRFAANAAHELRTPLAVMRSELDVSLRERTITVVQAREALESTREEVIRLQRVTEGLLQLATHTDEELRARFQDLSVASCITQACERMHMYAELESVSVTYDAPKVEVRGHEVLLVELLAVLIENSIRYRGNNKPAVHLTAEQDREKIRLIVTDNGVGISEQIQKRLFTYDPDERKEENGGHGLGLPLAKQIVDLHQGSISVRSAAGIGTEVSVVLPRG
jgi:signal transduction histidine kinase